MIALQLIGGLVLLFLGGDWLVDGCVAIANRCRISPMVIGLTIVAFGTSAPELLVSTTSALKGSEGIAMGNVIGSNIANIGLILGLTAILCPIMVENMKSVLRSGGVMVGASLLLILFSLDGQLSRVEGIVLFLCLIIYTAVEIIMSRRNETDHAGQEEKSMGLLPSILLILLSFGMLAFGSDQLVDGACSLARLIGVSEKVIGLTIVAFGTSLPELAASVAAALKKQMDISIGNIIGSNLFNILSVLGITASIKPILFSMSDYSKDFTVMMAFALALLILIQPWKQTGRLSRAAGTAMFLSYILYAYFLF